MDMTELLKLGAQVFAKSNLSGEAGSGLDLGKLTSALSGLTGGQGEGGGLDLGLILSNMEGGGLGSVLQSWLGDGTNDTISPDQISEMLGSDKISEFAAKLGVSQEEAAGGLSEALPQMVDNASSGGSLLDSIGGIEGAIGLAKKFFA